MRFIDKLERKFRRFGIPNLMIYITATMLMVFLLELVLQRDISSLIDLNRTMILQGQVWRLVTFIFVPVNTSPLWIILSLYFYYSIGSTLENSWGTTRFTLYYLFGMIGAIIGMFITGYASNMYLNLSLFLVYAYLFPDTQFMLFFIIPIKAKYLAYVDVAGLLILFVINRFPGRLAIVFAFLNFFLFFGPDLWQMLKQKKEVRDRRKRYKKNEDDYRDYWR